MGSLAGKRPQAKLLLERQNWCWGCYSVKPVRPKHHQHPSSGWSRYDPDPQGASGSVSQWRCLLLSHTFPRYGRFSRTHSRFQMSCVPTKHLICLWRITSASSPRLIKSIPKILVTFTAVIKKLVRKLVASISPSWWERYQATMQRKQKIQKRVRRRHGP